VGLPIDPEIKHAFVDQVISGIEWQATKETALQVTYVHRDFDRFWGFVRPLAEWYPVEGQDPGPDGVPGSADDGDVISVFALAPNTDTSRIFSNPDGASRLYDALQFVARTRYSSWQTQASYTWSATRGNVDNGFQANSGIGALGAGGAFANPNRAINTDGPASFDFSRELKVLTHGYLDVLGGISVGAIYRYTPGQRWARRAQIRTPQIIDTVLVEPQGSRRLPAINNLDLRIEKDFRLTGIGRIGLAADVFNLTNQGVPNSDASSAVRADSGFGFGEPIAWVNPRLLRVGVRFMF